jgi:diguanylate cyclase (GGDEF)-like protein/PAS domain S-box-containing protein
VTDAEHTIDPDTFEVTAARLGALFEHVDELVLCCDDGGTINFASESLRTVLGFDQVSVIGHNVTEFVHPDDLAGLADGIVRWAGRSGAPRGEVIRVRGSDGTWRRLHYDSVHGGDLGPLGTLVATLRPADSVDPASLDRRFRLISEDRVVRLASAFLHVPFEDFEKGLDDALRELATLEWVTRVSVWQADGDRVALRGSWAAPVNVPSVPLSSRIRMRDFEVMRLVSLGEEVHLTVPWHHGPEFAAERALFERAGTQSLLAAPLWTGDGFAGMVMLESTLPDGDFGVEHVISVRSAAAILAEAFARHEAETRLAEQARTDRVTGLGNRWAFDEALDQALNAVASGVSPGFGMAIIDLDRFKLVNDSLGHAVGDRLLADVAARLSGAAGPTTVLARLGGDELLVLVDESPSAAATLAAVEALIEPLAVPFDVGGETMVVTASVGVLHQADSRITPGDLLRWVDLAMYRAKAFGGDTIEMDDPADRAGQSSRMRRVAELRQAVHDEELVVHYQGEWDLESGRLIGAEALARWEHPTEGLLVAGEFIPLAEATGLIDELGGRVLRDACVAAAPWAEQLSAGPFVLRVNIAAQQLRRPQFVEHVADALLDSGLPAAALCLELTESTLLADPVGSAALFTRLRRLGVGLAIDDFGTGYSSILQLKQLPLTALKIDRAFVEGLPDDSSDRAIVRATLALAAALDITVTAEGVETEGQRDALLELGCRRAQGFLLARPEAAADFTARVRACGAAG